MPLQRQLDQAVEQLRVRNPRGLEELGVDARRGEAGDRVQLVDEHLAVAHEEVDARHPLAVRRHVRAQSEVADALDRVRRQARRHDQVHPALVVLGRVVVPVRPAEPVGDDLARQRRDRIAVPEHAALDLDPVDELLDQDLLVVLEGERDRFLELLGRARLRHADRRAEARRLDEDREAERVRECLPRANRDAARDGDPLVAHDRLEQVLVHAERRRRDARADVRDGCELEQALHGAVLAEGSVEDWQHDVDLAERRRRRRRGRNGQRLCRPWPGVRHRGRSVSGECRISRAGFELPAAVAADRDRHRVVALRVERLQHRAGGGERDLVLARAASHQDGNLQSTSHGTGAFSSLKRPTTIVTSLCGLACVPAAGRWSRTKPSRSWSITSWCSTWTLKPCASSVALAVCSSVLVTSGTVTVSGVCGPFETESVTVVWRGWKVPLSGSRSTTVPSRLPYSTSARINTNPGWG